MMGKSKGFSLIELIVSIAIMAIIMGVLAHLFGVSVKQELMGFNQQDMYSQSRRVENELKNTLRYTFDKRYTQRTLKFYKADEELEGADRSDANLIDKIEYESLIYNNAKECNQKIAVNISWTDASKNQIKIVKDTSDEKVADDGTKTFVNKVTETYYFPKNVDNSAFEGKFPITVVAQEDAGTELHAGMLKINLPFKYKTTGGDYKTNALETKVAYMDVTEEEEDGDKYVLGACINAKSNIWNGESNDIENYSTVTGIYKDGYWGGAPNIARKIQAANALKLGVSESIFPTSFDETRILNGDYNKYDINFSSGSTKSLRLQSQWGGAINIKNSTITGAKGAVLTMAFSGVISGVDFIGPLTLYLPNPNNNLTLESCHISGDVVIIVKGEVKFDKLRFRSATSRLALFHRNGYPVLDHCDLNSGSCFISTDRDLSIKGGAYKGQLQGNNIKIEKGNGGRVPLIEDTTVLKNLKVMYDSDGNLISASF